MCDQVSRTAGLDARTIVLNAQFGFPGVSMADLAHRTVAAARTIDGNREAGAVTRVFEDRGTLTPGGRLKRAAFG
jgi:hypothetical protein